MSKKFSKDHYVLLKNSHAINTEPRLKALLEKDEEITDALIHSLDGDMQNIFRDMIPKLIELAQAEWRAEEYPDEDRGDDREDWVKCSLCGTPNKIVYYIHNTQNGKSLNVGSHCITKFDILENQGINHKEYQRRIRRYLRINKLNKRFPGIERTIDNWNNALDLCPLILPYSLEKPYIDLKDRIRNCFDTFIKDNCTADEEANIIKNIHDILNEEKQWSKQVEAYLKKYNEDKFAPRNTIRLWLKGQSDAVLTDWLKEDGLITQRTAHRITEPNFMNMIAEEFKQLSLELDYEISVWKADPSRKGYIIYCDPIKSAALLCSHSMLIRRFGSAIFGGEKKEPKLHEILALCSVASENSYYRISEALANKLRGSSVSFHSEDYRFDEIIFLEKATGQYVILELQDFIKKFILVAYDCSNEPLEVVTNYILQPSRRRYSRDDINEHQKNIARM